MMKKMKTLKSACCWVLFFLLSILALICLFGPPAMGLMGAPLVIGWGLAFLLWKGMRFVLGELMP